MPSNYLYGGTTDFDDIFKPRGIYTARANTNYRVGSQDLADRYCPTADLGPGLKDTITESTNARIVGGIDLSTLFRYIECPDVTLTGPSSVTASSYNGEEWPFTASSSSTITGVRFQVVDHGAGNWTSVSTSYYSGHATWSYPFSSPPIADVPGTYVFYFQAMDENHWVGDARMTVTVN